MGFGFKKIGNHRKGFKVLVYGPAGVGKTVFALSFPKVVAIDSEDGMSWYEDMDYGKNLIGSLPTQNFKKIRDILEKWNTKEIAKELGETPQTLVIDSETKIHEVLQSALLSVDEMRAAAKGHDTLDANLSMRSWGKIGQIEGQLQNLKIRVATSGMNLISIAQSKDVMEAVGKTDRIKVGETPNMKKNVAYDYDLVLRLFVKDGKFMATVEKDRTGVTTVGQEIENPSYKIWKDALEKGQEGETVEKNFAQDVKEAERAYTVESNTEMPFKDRVVEYVKTLNSDEKANFLDKVEKEVGTKVFREMDASQKAKVLSLLEA